LIYADGADFEHRIPVGVTCRVCERNDCSERAFPAQQAPLVVDENVRAASFYRSRLPILGG
jgi:predicted transcriptional regulator